MLTEQEAKERWCPFAQTYVPGTSDGHTPAFNRPAPEGSRIHDDTRCIASQCMAWRWLEDWRVQPKSPGPGWVVEQETGSNKKWVFRERGFCGLAGHPNPALVASL